MRFSEAKNRKVISTTGANTVGRLNEFVIDPRTAHVVALRLKKAQGKGDTLTWNDMKSFGQDAIIVESPEAIAVPQGDLAALCDKRRSMLGKRILTERGDSVGKVKDVEFDADSGRVRAVITENEEIDGPRIVGLGTYALVIRAQPPTAG
jgi:sporulation protein YlmC with PRC-barrel domain